MKKMRILGILLSIASGAVSPGMAFLEDYDSNSKASSKFKLMSFNSWGGHFREDLLKFMELQQDIDVICVQEAYKMANKKISTNDDPVSLDIFSEIVNVLPNHTAHFRPVVDGIYGIGMFVKSSVKVLEEGESIIHENPSYVGKGPTHSRILQWVKCQFQGTECTVINVHGLWNGQGKKDTPERLAQSTRITDFLKKVNTPKIVCGDFNLLPETQSIQILEEGMINLVREYGVTSTRTSHYTKSEKYADYIFTSPELKVLNFDVLKEEVSDHSPLVVFFEFNDKKKSVLENESF